MSKMCLLASGKKLLVCSVFGQHITSFSPQTCFNLCFKSQCVFRSQYFSSFELPCLTESAELTATVTDLVELTCSN